MDKPPIEIQTASTRPFNFTESRISIQKINNFLSEARQELLKFYRREGWKSMGYKSFRECIQAEMKQSPTEVYRQLQAAQIEIVIGGGDINKVGTIPEGKIRPLTPIKKEPELVKEAWNQANEATNGKPTGKDVAMAVDEVIAKHRPSAASIPDDDRDDEDDEEESEDEDQEESEDEWEEEEEPEAVQREPHVLTALARTSGKVKLSEDERKLERIEQVEKLQEMTAGIDAKAREIDAKADRIHATADDIKETTDRIEGHLDSPGSSEGSPGIRGS